MRKTLPHVEAELRAVRDHVQRKGGFAHRRRLKELEEEVARRLKSKDARAKHESQVLIKRSDKA